MLPVLQEPVLLVTRFVVLIFLVTSELLRALLLGLPVMAFGMYLGGRMHTDISQRTFTLGISALLLVSGIILML